MRPAIKRAVKIIGIVAVTLVAAAILFLFSREEVYRYKSPSGDHTVVVTKYNYESFVIRFPGGGSDAPGFIEIFDRNGESCGRVPVPMIQFYGNLFWRETGAYIPALAEWDFKQRTCSYWSEDGSQEIWVRRK